MVAQSGRDGKTTDRSRSPAAADPQAQLQGRRRDAHRAVPVAGRVTISGKGLRKVSRKRTKAGSFTVKVKLSKKGAASRRALKRKKRKLSVKLTASFKPTEGASSRATRKLVFK